MRWPWSRPKSRPESVEDILRKRANNAEGVFIFASFAAIFSYKFDIKGRFGISSPDAIDISGNFSNFLSQALTASNWQSFIIEDSSKLILFICTYIWYTLYKFSVQNEITIIGDLFSKLNPISGHTESDIIGGGYTKYLAYGIASAFLLMSFFCDNLIMYCSIILLLSAQDLFGNSLIQNNLYSKVLFNVDPLLSEDARRPFIEARRQVAKSYWIDRPQLPRVALMITTTIFALLISLNPMIMGISIPSIIPVCIIVFTIISNEVVMNIWRDDRDKRLNKILDDETAQIS